MRKALITEVIRQLRIEREKQKLSMSAVAQRSGLSQSMISLVENNHRSPTLDTLLRIAEVLEVDLGQMISKSKPMELGQIHE
ncbi:MAG: helix-turn-helix transcriptional regulator [Verrucomicrobia bacterium]|nr:helix-turn-helix transcriptional regulator [Verrucomicrobiota bacterium]